MPNHCYQSVYLQGPRAVVQELYYQLTEHNRFCDAVISMPLDSVVDGYSWRVEKWGTKWDVAEAEITQDIDVSANEIEAWFAFRCWTAWAPPVPVWDKLHALGVTVEAEYQDEGMMFEGEYSGGENRSWVPEFEEEAV